jgi:hypothetical protein
MSDLEQLIEAANKICRSLDQMAANDKKFCVDMQIALERASWEIERNLNEPIPIMHFYKK